MLLFISLEVYIVDHIKFHLQYYPIDASYLILSLTKLLNQHFTGIIVLVALFFWDNKKEEEQLVQISRDETLSRLPLRLSTNRIVELVQLRDTARPVSNSFSLSLRCSLIILCCAWMSLLFLRQDTSPQICYISGQVRNSANVNLGGER